MKRNILNSVLLLSLVVCGTACRPKKVIVATPPPVVVNTPPVVTPVDRKPDNLAMLKGKDLPFNTLSLRGKASLNVGGDENNVTMNIKIEKDKKIWVSITGIAGIEGARAVITPDSLLLRNNLQKTYLKKPFNYIYGFTNKQVNFGLLQALLSGNTMPDLMTVKSALVQDNGVWVLTGTNGDLSYRTAFNTLLKIAETTLNDAKSAQALKVIYGEYTPVNNALFPSSLKLNSMSAAKKIDINIEFVKIESNVPVEFPFSIPKNYTAVN